MTITTRRINSSVVAIECDGMRIDTLAFRITNPGTIREGNVWESGLTGATFATPNRAAMLIATDMS